MILLLLLLIRKGFCRNFFNDGTVRDVNINEAQQNCMEYGQYLASIHSDKQKNAVIELCEVCAMFMLIIHHKIPFCLN